MFLLASLKAEEGAATGGLGGIQVMAAGARQARVVDLGDEGMVREGLSQDGTVACLSLHAQRHGFQATQAQPAVKWTQDGALSVLQTPYWFRTPAWLGTLVLRRPWRRLCELWQCAKSLSPCVFECRQAPEKEAQRAAPYSA